MKNRILVGFCICAMLFGGLYARLLYLSSRTPLAAAAKEQTSVTLDVSQARANIYDCNMQKLVNKNSELTAAVFPVPENLTAVKENMRDELDSEELMELYSASRPFAVAANNNIDAQNVEMFDAVKRYRDDQTAAHVIGCVGSDGSGTSGIERAYNAFLNKYKTVETISYPVNGAGELLMGEQPKITRTGSAAAGVILTLDSKIQSIVESVGRRGIKNGAVVVMDPGTGDIKAMASFPTFSQNNLEKSVNDTENTPMINRTLSPYAVGSTFKICTAAAALEAGINEIWYNCTGKTDVHGQSFSCHEIKGHGTLTMKQAMAKSCNTYFIRLGLRLDRIRLRNMASDLSFGKSFELADKMVSQAGTLPSVNDLENPAEVANFAFGQGKLTATPLQITMMTCCVVNGGKLNYPRLVEGTTVDGETVKKTKVKAQMDVMSAETAEKLMDFLEYGVMNTQDQYAAPVSTTAGGKTATAQTGKFSGGLEQLNTWFTGYFPADDPKYVVTVLTENGVWGNTSASPVFQKIADRVTALEAEEENKNGPDTTEKSE